MEYFSALQKSPLFQGVGDSEIAQVAKCLGARLKKYAKGQSVYDAGDFAREIGVVVKGLVHVVKDDAWGNRNIIGEAGPGVMFAESFVCGGVGELPVSVVAVSESEIMFADFQRVITQCGNACVFHSLMIRNIVGVLARKNVTLQGKMEHITKRTTREKLLSYLSERSRLSGSASFEIPFDRQGLADYLSVERSALSAEMSRLRAEGVIDYRKSRFEIVGAPPAGRGAKSL